MTQSTLEQPLQTSNQDPDSIDNLLQTQVDEQNAWLRKIARVCEVAARGDLEARILNVDVEGDLARVIHGINSLLDYTDAFVREAKAVLECSSQGKFFRRVVPRGMCGAFKQASEIINSASHDMQMKSEEIEQANIRRLQMADDFDTKVKSVTSMVATTASELQLSSTSLSDTAQQTSVDSSSALEASAQAVENVQNVTNSTNQIQDAVSRIDEQVQGSALIVHRAVSEALQAKDIIEGLKQSSSNIDTVVETISSISKQTELLALNAAIEAARAGDAGRGFAVVAAEVRKLAEETRSATQNAKQEINSVQVSTNKAVGSINDFSETVAQLNETTNSIAEFVSDQRHSTADISNNVAEAANRIEDVTENIRHATTAAVETAKSADTMHLSSNELSAQADSLLESVEKFILEIRPKERISHLSECNQDN